jgi:hypothetical protein
VERPLEAPLHDARVEAVVESQVAAQRLVDARQERLALGEEPRAARRRQVLELRVAVVDAGVGRVRREGPERQLEEGRGEIGNGREREARGDEDRPPARIVRSPSR